MIKVTAMASPMAIPIPDTVAMVVAPKHGAPSSSFPSSSSSSSSSSSRRSPWCAYNMSAAIPRRVKISSSSSSSWFPPCRYSMGSSSRPCSSWTWRMGELTGVGGVVEDSLWSPRTLSSSSDSSSWRKSPSAMVDYGQQRAPSTRRRSSQTVEASAAKSDSSNSDGEGEEDPLIVCFGELLIDFVPTVNGVSLAEASAFKKAPGGAPANVAVGVARLGGNSAFIGKVGDDEFGHMLAGILKDNHVETQGIRFDANARTALAFVTLKDDGEREFMFYRNPSADMLLSPKELDEELIRDAAVFHYGSISLISEPSRSAHMKAMQLAKEGGALLSYDPNLRLPLWRSPEDARDEILSIWDSAQIIKISDEELEFLSEGGDSNSEDVVRRFWHDELLLLLVTRGAGGASYYTPSFSGHVPGVRVNTIDTTGAGDAFVAGLLLQIASSQSIIMSEDKLRATLRFANACGAITTTERGAIPALPDLQAVLAMSE